MQSGWLKRRGTISGDIELYWIVQSGEENSEIVAYLQRYFHGTKEEMLAIFEAGNKGGMYDRIFVESVLKACIADGVDGTEFKVFSTYIQQVQIQ